MACSHKLEFTVIMMIDDVRKLENCNTETDLIKIIQKISDAIYFKRYNQEQVLSLVNEIIKIDLLSIKYDIRKEILFLLCEASSNYDISDCAYLKSIVDIRSKLENDLKEYVDEIIENISYYGCYH